MSDLTSAKRWFREARLGAFIHWGLYALPGGVWNGTSVPYLAEWLQAARRIPNAEYARLAEQFNPRAFDADAIVKAFADAGMRYVVFTAKHHEGFAMWHSRVSPFNSYDATPAHRDFVAEWADACRRHGVKLGLYYSHCLDWHEPDGGDPRPCPDNFGMSWGNDWDFPDQTAKNFDRYFENKALPQLAELLTGYGEVAVLWLDCPMQVITPHHARRILDLVRRLQPNCLVNSRLCMCETLGDYGSLGDNQLPAGVTAGDFPREAIVTLNDSWGYKTTDHHWKSPAQIRQIVLDAMQSGANLLVNFGPDGDGQLTSASWAILRDLAEWQPAIGEALHSGGQTPFPQDLGWAHAVAADRRLWLFPHPDAPAVATLAGINDKVLKINNIQTFVQKRQPIRLDFPETPIYDPCPCIQNGRMTLLPSKAELIHGKDITDNNARAAAPLGAAGERLGEGPHSSLADNGALSDWHNPADCCRWNVRLDPGRYQLRLITRNAAHSQPWRGDRIIELILGDQCITASLKATALIEDSNYYRAAATDLGEISLDHGGKYQLTLRTTRLTAPEAATMQLERLELHAVP